MKMKKKIFILIGMLFKGISLITEIKIKYSLYKQILELIKTHFLTLLKIIKNQINYYFTRFPLK